MAIYGEHELMEPVKLCTSDGALNRAATGWSRFPLHSCNLSGHWPKKKKWNFWCVINEDVTISATIANVDYIGIGAAVVLDFNTKVCTESAIVIPKGLGLKMPERVEEDVFLKNPQGKFAFTHPPQAVNIKVDWPSFQGKKLLIDITLEKAAAHETLNVVIPWSDELFHFTSKQNTLPANGTVKLGDVTYEFKPENSYGILDFGRGIWRDKIVWNWASFSHRQDSDLIGLNLGSKWTDGTGANENGVCLNGTLYKISEDVPFLYNTSNFMEPWRMKSESDAVDLTLTPVYLKGSGGNSAASTNQVYGHFNGTLKAGSRVIRVDNAFGWAEEMIGSW